MKGKRINLFFVITILFTVLFPSLHDIAHLAETSHGQCDHRYALGKNEVSHSHDDTDHCVGCDYIFSAFIAEDIFAISQESISIKTVSLFLSSLEDFTPFSGSLYFDRGPPFIIA